MTDLPDGADNVIKIMSDDFFNLVLKKSPSTDPTGLHVSLSAMTPLPSKRVPHGKVIVVGWLLWDTKPSEEYLYEIIFRHFFSCFEIEEVV